MVGASEQYLVNEGYQAELKQAVLKYHEPTFVSAQHQEAKEREITGWTDEVLLGYMKAWKTKLKSALG